jgi:nucleotide-binding universal stress UspA family protein
MRSKPENVNWKKILVPLDLTLETGEKIQLAMEFALNFGAEISLLTVMQNADEENKKRLSRRAKMALDRITSHKIAVESNMIQSKDDIAEVVVKYAEDSGCDLVVIMTQQEHKDIKEHLLGTHAEHVVNRSKVPVMSIKPKREYRTTVFAGSHFG